MTTDILMHLVPIWPRQPSAQVIAVVILALLVAGSVAAVTQIIRLWGRERHALARVERLIHESYEGETVSVDGQQATRRMVEIARLLDGIDSRSRIADRLRTIADMKKRHVAISVKTLQEMTSAQERASTGMAFPSFATNTAMLLGLLGTFFGLADMVGTLNLVVGSNVLNSYGEWQRAIAGLREALSGMNTAFVTSLYGMFTATVLSFLTFAAKRMQANILARLETFTARDLLPATTLATEEQTILERATFTLGDAFDRLSTIQARNNETLQSLDGVQKTFLGIVDSVRAITTDKESRNLDAAVSAMSDLAGRIPDLVQAIDRTNAELRTGLGELTRRERLDRRLRNAVLRNGFRGVIGAILGRRSKSGAAR